MRRAMFAVTALGLLACGGGEPRPAPAPPPVAAPAEVGFDWLHPDATRCTPVEGDLARTLAGATCADREPGEAFGIDRGPWRSCRLGDAEWLLFPTAAICDEMIETMRANAP